MSTIFASYRGINRQYHFTQEPNQLNVQISKLTGRVLKTLTCQQQTLPKPNALTFSSFKDQITWLLTNGYSVHHKGQKVFFHPSLQGGMVKDEEDDIPEQEIKRIKKIGEGGFGDVYLGKYIGIDVAIKELRNDLANDPQFINELRQESEMMKTLNHPYIVRFYGVFNGAKMGLVMEFAHKGSLYQMRKSGELGQLPTNQRLQFALHILYGLNYLHRKNIVHRDLKSLNVLVDKDRNAKVADFGLSKAKTISRSLHTVVGTPGWMAPEVLTNKPYGFESDIYSFGMVVWELVELKIPFLGKDPMQVMMQLLQTNKKEEEISANVNPTIANIMRACWQTEPSNRPTIADLITQFETYLQENNVVDNFNQLNLNVPPAVPKVVPIQQVVPIQVDIPAMAFGKEKWETYFGDVGAEPSLPANMEEILASPCPIWPNKRVYETHVLTLVPKTVNGKLLTLKTMGELVKNLKQGNKTEFRYFYPGGHENDSSSESHWVLMTKDVIPNSRNKSYSDQKQLVQTYNNGGIAYEVVRLLDATVSVLMEYVANGVRLLSDAPWTYTRCQETYKKEGKRQMVVGGFSASGLLVYAYYCNAHEYDGIVFSRKFF